MGHAILKLAEESFIVWSSVVDAPVSYIMTEKECREWYAKEHGRRHSQYHLDQSIRDAHKTGSSSTFTTLDDIKADNKAGADEEYLTLGQIIEKYVAPVDTSVPDCPFCGEEFVIHEEAPCGNHPHQTWLKVNHYCCDMISIEILEKDSDKQTIIDALRQRVN